MLGNVDFVEHAFYNYQYYREAVPSDARILVIRKSHITSDLNDLESFFGGGQDSLLEEPVPVFNSHDTKAVDLVLSNESKRLLCRELCNEIQVYKQILSEALNLDEVQLRVSLDELKVNCPLEAVEDRCHKNRINIRVKLEENRGYRGEDMAS